MQESTSSHRVRTHVWVGVWGAAALLVTGCSNGAQVDPDAASTATGTPATQSAPAPTTSPLSNGSSTVSPTQDASGVTSSPAAVDAAPPARGLCYPLSKAQAVSADTSVAPVACRRTHTAQTYKVGTLDLVRNGHLLAVGSRAATAQVATACRSAFSSWVGGDPRLSVLAPTWFTPTLEQSDAGASWYRCDVVALAARDTLEPLPRATRGMLTRADERAAYALCRTASPATPASQVVPCRSKHAYRAVKAVDLPGRTLPATAAGNKVLDGPCKEAAQALLEDPLATVVHVQELPTAAQWSAGRRYGLCWVPD